MRYVPREYQEIATSHILENEVVTIELGAGMFLDMGLGKTVSTLTAIEELIFKRREIRKVLVIAPKRVAESTWTDELEKWDHLRHLKVSVCLGSAKERIAAINAKAHIYTINRENVPWLVGLLAKRWPFDMVVIDESSSFKSPQAARFKAMRAVRPKLRRIVLLTGTPAPNGLLDLWPQMYLVDKGKRLEKTIGAYRAKYFQEGKRRGDVVYSYNLRPGEEWEGEDMNKVMIYKKIEDICISMKARDWLTLPPRIDSDMVVHMPSDLQSSYKAFVKEAFLELENAEITALNKAALTGKLLQFSSGAVYDEHREAHEVHRLKLDALEEYMESAQGENVLLFYNFKHEIPRIMKRLAKYKPQLIGGRQSIRDWNDGKINVLLAHPASAGHGLNLQHGGRRVVWFGLPWSLELYEQAVARLDRQGQTKSVLNTHIICAGTMDEKVVEGLKNKAFGQDQLMAALKVEASRAGVAGVKFKAAKPKIEIPY